MSATQNTDAIGQGQQFSSKVAPSEPLQSSGHKQGVLASENDRAPEFSAQTLPAGTAPKDSTYQPNPDLNNQKMYQSAGDTLTGADSKDVHTGLGHPGQGQTSSELHHDGQSHRKRQGLGTVGLTTEPDSHKPIDPHDPYMADQRSLEGDHPTGRIANQPNAEDRVPETL